MGRRGRNVPQIAHLTHQYGKGAPSSPPNPVPQQFLLVQYDTEVSSGFALAFPARYLTGHELVLDRVQVPHEHPQVFRLSSRS